MKRFALILIVAVLALGCVFADTVDKHNPTSGDKFVVKTTIGVVYPVYQIVGINETAAVTSATSSKAGNKEVEGILSNDGDSISIKVELQHFGYTGNLTTNALTDIRYKGSVNVTITANPLINQFEKDGTKITADTDGHVFSSANPTVGAFTGTTVDNFKSTCSDASTSSNEVLVKAEYTNGLKVATGSGVKAIANGSFTWDISKLTAGDTYKADVVVTYEVQ